MVEGMVHVTFVVEKDGSLSDIKVVKEIGSGCDEEAIRVISNAPKWEPGRQRGHKVRVKLTISIRFVLQENIPLSAEGKQKKKSVSEFD